jgi:uncharacterized SAM-binding protein YcdF (DUF218 family)
MNAETSRRSRHRFARGWTALAAVALAVLGFFVFAFLNVGRWLVREDPPEKAQAIVVLSGGMPIRALEAARLYHEGYAPTIWLTQPAEPREMMRSLGVPYEGEDDVNARVLVHEGVPESAIRVLQPPILNTADEMRTIAEVVAAGGKQPVIVVTSKAHTRRVRALWRSLERGKGRIVVRAAVDDPFDPEHWWRTTGDALDVVREVLGLFNVWAGLPLRPAS